MIQVTVPYAVSKDDLSMSGALAHLGGATSFRYPKSLPGELVAILHRPGATTEAQFRAAVLAAIRDAPAPFARPVMDEVAFRRALAKSARGKPLTPEETAALDFAEST